MKAYWHKFDLPADMESGLEGAVTAETDPIFRPIAWRNLHVKNRIFRSSISGRIDNYDGSGTPARINWEERFARGGVGAIISAHVPVHVRGRILPNYAFIDRDSLVPFWRQVGERVHRHDCRFIVQLAHAGRQRDIAGVENDGTIGLSASDGVESFHGFRHRAMTVDEIKETTANFAAGARRAREAGLDGVEIHAANGYLFTQFLSPAINHRQDDYGGTLENRARLLLETVAAIWKEVGSDFHLQVKISAVDHNNAFWFWQSQGTTIDDSVQVCSWLEKAGVDAIHVSTGNMFLHPLNPPGGFPVDFARQFYGSMMPSGRYVFRNYLFFRYRVLTPLFAALWNRTKKGRPVEGLNLADARRIKQAVEIPVICTGGFQTGSVIRAALESGDCDAVSMARPLIANPDLPQVLAAGSDLPARPCTYCNKCLIAVLDAPLGCYEISRFDGDHERMMREVMSFYPQENGLEVPG